MKTKKISKQKKAIRLIYAFPLVIIVLIFNSAFKPTPKLTDPEIAFIVEASNQIEINFAKIAKEKTKNKDILKFANTMLTDHQSIIDQTVVLVKKVKIMTKDNSTSKKLFSDAEVTKKMLKSKSGNEFNKAYIDEEVSNHKAVVNTVQNVLIPQTQNAELKALLVKILPILKSHLEHAEMVQKMFVK